MTPPAANLVVHVVGDDRAGRAVHTRPLSGAGYVVREYASAQEFLRDRPGRTLDCVVLDLAQTGMGGLALQAVLAHETDPWPIVFLTGPDRLADGIMALKAGAVDFLPKPASPEQLVAAVQRAGVLDERQRVVRLLRADWLAHRATLTPRQGEVLRQIIAGQTNQDIARALGTSERTIKAHRAQVMDKMQAASFAQLAFTAGRVGLDESEI